MIIFLIFGIFGIQLYSESFYYRCRLTPKPVFKKETNIFVWEKDPLQTNILCSNRTFGLYTCLEGTFCGSPYNYNLRDIDRTLDDAVINYGVLTFDHLGKALLSIF
jgi:hypothetical protein